MGKYLNFAKETLLRASVMGAKETLLSTKERSEEANVNTVMGFIVTAVVLGIGVVILYQVETATPAINGSSAWATTQTSLATTTQSGYGLLAITLIVGAAGAILAAVLWLGKGQN